MPQEKNIVLHETDEDLRDVFVEALEREGYKVVVIGANTAPHSHPENITTTLANHRNALAAVFDLDREMFPLSELVRTVEAAAWTAPVVIISTLKAQVPPWSDSKKIVSLSKPFALSELVEVLRRF